MRETLHLHQHLDGERFWADVEAQAAIGALETGGIRRLALDDADVAARLWLIDQAGPLGCTAFYDDLGNVFLRREGSEPELAPLLIGSHLDSQPNAGAYDGALGVVARLAVLRALHDAGAAHDRPVEVVAWTNEEGARFAPGASGSSWFAGTREREAIVAAEDDEGMPFGAALEHCLARLSASGAAHRPAPYRPHAFLELHIEQGPVLESLGCPVCVVTGIQGVTWYEVEVQGQANHAGTTPAAARQDAFMGAHRLIGALREAAETQDEALRFTIGKFRLWPDSVNTIADLARFTIDLRHPDPAVLDTLDKAFQRLAEEDWEGCRVTLGVSSRVAPVAFDAALLEALEASVASEWPEAPQIVSGAFHDAIHLARCCPTAMLFTPCRKGISHHPDEHIEKAEAVIATRALVRAVDRLLAS
jgi:beta-ureidopropionase / N-carbamoyl-L-amino-acid hydrolase